MKLALDPYMLRTTPLTELPGVVAELGYEWIELSPREDFTPFFLHPRANRDTVRQFKSALDGAGVQVASHLPLYRWSGPDEDERQAAVRYWKRAIQLTVDLDCRVMNSEFNGRPEQASPVRGAVLAVDGGAAAGLRARGRAAAAGAAPGRLRRGRPGRGRHGPRDRLRPGLVPLLRAAHVPPGRRHRRRDAVRGRPAHPGARRRLLRPPGVLRAALHRQPARLDRPDPPAPGHRPGRGRLGRVLRHARRARLRRPGRHDHDRLRLRLGGAGPPTRPGSTGSGSSRRSSPGPDRPHPHPPAAGSGRGGWSSRTGIGGRRDGEPLSRRGRDRRRHGRPGPRQRLPAGGDRVRPGAAGRPAGRDRRRVRAVRDRDRAPVRLRAGRDQLAGGRGRAGRRRGQRRGRQRAAPRGRRGPARRGQARAVREAAGAHRGRRRGDGGRGRGGRTGWRRSG